MGSSSWPEVPCSNPCSQSSPVCITAKFSFHAPMPINLSDELTYMSLQLKQLESQYVPFQSTETRTGNHWPSHPQISGSLCNQYVPVEPENLPSYLVLRQQIQYATHKLLHWFIIFCSWSSTPTPTPVTNQLQWPRDPNTRSLHKLLFIYKLPDNDENFREWDV